MKEMILQNRYVIEKRIGRGGFGRTYLAHDNRVDIPVAVKEYLPQRQMSEEEARRETRMAAKFYDLEGVAAARDFFTENDHVYIILDYVDGVNIRDHIEKQGRMDGKDALQKMRPVIEAVGRIHEQGVIHRDISADNLMITEDDKIKLIDFGTARFMEDYYDRTYTQNFKHGFTPVEQYRSHEKQGPWTDIYSLCATIYFMITGIVPDISVDRLIDDRLLSLEKIQGTGLDRHQKQCIMKGLAVQPEHRYQDIAEFYGDLYLYQGGENKGQEKEKAEDGERSFFTTGFSTTSLLRDIKESVGGKREKKRRKKRAVLLSVIILAALGTVFYMKAVEKMPQTGSEPGSEGEPGPKVVSQTSVSEAAVQKGSDAGTGSEPEILYRIGDYKGLDKKSVKERTKELRKKGLKLIYKEKYSDKAAKGKVISQKPSAGKEYKDLKKISLVIVISKGKKPKPQPTASPAPTHRPSPTKTPSSEKPGTGGDSVRFSGSLDDIPN